MNSLLFMQVIYIQMITGYKDMSSPFFLHLFLVVSRTAAIVAIAAVAAYERTRAQWPRERSGLELLCFPDVGWLLAPQSRALAVSGNSLHNLACRGRVEEEVEQE